jgi:hypothetical protein
MNKEPVQNVQRDTLEADFPFWATMPVWSAVEFASLLLGLNPYLMRDHRQPDDASEDEYYSLRDLAWCLIDSHDIKLPYTPAKWLACAKKYGIHVPPALEAEVIKRSGVRDGNGTEVAQERDGAAHRQASQEDIRNEARRIYADATKNGRAGPNKVDATKEIRRALEKKKLNAPWRLIAPILDEGEFKKQRGERGTLVR